MQRFINEHLWFIINAALVAGLVVLSSALSARAPAQPAQSAHTAQAPQASPAMQVVVGTPSTTLIKQPAPTPVRTVPPPPPPTRPRIVGGEIDDDD